MFIFILMALFISGTENPADDESRERVAVEKETGGSYVVNVLLNCVCVVALWPMLC